MCWSRSSCDPPLNFCFCTRLLQKMTRFCCSCKQQKRVSYCRNKYLETNCLRLLCIPIGSNPMLLELLFSVSKYCRCIYWCCLNTLCIGFLYGAMEHIFEKFSYMFKVFSRSNSFIVNCSQTSFCLNSHFSFSPFPYSHSLPHECEW